MSIVNRFPQMAVSFAAVLLGATVMLGWYLRQPVMVQGMPGYAPVVFLSGLSFVLAGIATACAQFDSPQSRRASVILGGLLVAIHALVLTENLTGMDLGIDITSVHQWLNEGKPQSGRAAANTNLGFLCVGLLLMLQPRARSGFVAFLVQALTFALIAIGALGLVGYFLHLESLYGWYRSADMAPLTAIGLTALGAALWLTWHRSAWRRADLAAAADRRIVFLAATALVIVALTAGIGGFALLGSRIHDSISDRFRLQLRSKTEMFASRIGAGLEAMEFLAARPAIAPTLEALAQSPSDRERYDKLEVIAKSLLPLGYAGVVFSDSNGRELLRVGGMAQNPEVKIALKAPHEAALLWDHQTLILDSRATLLVGGVPVGQVATQRPLPDLTASLLDEEGLGETGEIIICGLLDKNRLQCLPTRRSPLPFAISVRNSRGDLWPTTRAINGERGIITTVDRHDQPVVVAYAPVAGLGLGMAFKMDSAELYQPVREQLHFLLPLLALLVVAATLMLRSQIRPLAEQLRRSERTAQRSEERLRTITDNVPVSIGFIDADLRLRFANKVLQQWLGQQTDHLIGLPFQEILGEEGYRVSAVAMEAALRGERVTFERRGTIDGREFYRQIAYIPEFDESKKVLGFYVLAQDITDRKQNEERLQAIALHDSLTGLANRQLLADRVALAIAHARRDQSALAVLYVDLDGFKQINDTLGHDAGDMLLKATAGRLVALVRGEDTVARLGGDEFVIVLWHISGADGAAKVAAKLIEAVSRPYSIQSQTVSITASAGIATYPDHGQDALTLMKSADLALYAAKGAGKNAYRIAERSTGPELAAAPSE